jgi:hypothetical protein
MSISQRAVSDNRISKVVFGLAAVFFVFAPPTARAGGPGEIFDFQICNGYFALCAASTCTPTGNQITFRTAAGGTATAQEADCTCPVILGSSIANLAGGNMQGSCAPPGPGQLWSSYQVRPDIPQALTNWVPTLPEAAAQPLFCPSSLNLGNQFTQCFSYSCDSETYINNVPVVTCHCAIGVDLSGNPTQPHASFVSQAGQGDQAFCFEHPVGNGPGSLPLP